jgi:hypothetical protein
MMSPTDLQWQTRRARRAQGLPSTTTAERKRLYRRRHPERVKEAKKAHALRNPEAVRAVKQRWRNKHKTDTAIRNLWARWRRTARRLLVIQELGGKCVDCGEDYPLFLEFDHQEPSTKEHNVCGRGSLISIRKEASKCVLRCSNHHRLKTWIYEDRQAWRKGGGT